MDEAKKRDFIGRISRALGREAIPDYVAPFDMSHGPQADMYDDLTQDQVVAMFKTECEKVGTHYIETTKDQLGQVLLDEIEKRGGGKVIYPNSDEVREYNLEELFAKEPADKATFIKWDASKGRDANINASQDAEIGITFPVMGIAETATVVQPSTEESGRSIGLLPITHIAVLHTDTLVPRMTQSMAALSEVYKEDPSSFPTNIVHISGPSNTADIELVRVVGVHGPINVTFILVD